MTMAKKHARNARAPTQQRTTTSGLAWLCSPETYGLLSGYTPEIRLNTVVLPEPFGPIRP